MPHIRRVNIPAVAWWEPLTQWLLALGLTFSLATQLRFVGLPVGPGEVLLLLWLLLSAPLRREFDRARLVRLLLVGGACAVLLLSWGSSTYPEGNVRPDPRRDLLAYAFGFVLLANLVSLGSSYGRALLKKLPLSLVALVVVAMLGAFVSLEKLASIDLFYYETRLQLLSNNPNQLALLILPFPLLAIHLLLDEKTTAWWTVFYTIIGLMALFIGWASQSDALFIAWVIGAVSLALVALIRDRKSLCSCSLGSARGRRGWAAILVLATMFSGSLWQSRDLAKPLYEYVTGATFQEEVTHQEKLLQMQDRCIQLASLSIEDADADQLGVRLCLWRNAISAIWNAPLSGWGGGAHSGLSSPFGGMEAHNTLLDWGTQTGLLGALALAVLFGWVTLRLLRSGCAVWVGLFIALLVFSMFHFVLRQPLFWLLPAMALMVCNAQRESSVSGSQTHSQS